MLDTSAYSMLRRGHAGIRDTLRTAEAVYMSPVVLGELHTGFRGGTRSAENERLLGKFLLSPRVEIAAIAEETALCYAQIVHYLRGKGRPVPINDVWIAAGAMERGLRIVATDAHFREIPQIRLEYHERL
jgi:tRNA(fMet)-specific endonuclease VapC